MSIVSVALWATAAIIVVALLVAAVQVWRTQRIAAEAERAVPPAGRFVEVAGNRIHYVEKGEGRPILFIHGLGAQLHQFRSPLFGRLDGFRLIAIDRPGSGYSVRAGGASGRLSEQASVVRGFIEALGLERPLVVGHSLGGAVALTLAIEHPEVVSGLALLSPHTRHSGKVAPEFAPLYIRSPLKRWLVSHTVAVPASQKFAAQTLAYVFGPQEAPADYMTEGGGWLGLRPSHFYGASTDIVDLVDDPAPISDRYCEIAVPVGILYGTADRVLDHRKHGADMVGKIPNLDLELAEGVGHMPQFAEPERTVAFIRRIAARAFAPRAVS
jgi:pimeloyl-ACP methyl ester carboxylesterase